MKRKKTRAINKARNKRQHSKALKSKPAQPILTELESDGPCSLVQCSKPIYKSLGDWILDPDGLWHFNCYPKSRFTENIDLKYYWKHHEEIAINALITGGIGDRLR